MSKERGETTECEYCGAPCTWEASGFLSSTMNADGTLTDHGPILVAAYAEPTAAPPEAEQFGIYVASRVKRAPVWEEYKRQGYPIISTWLNETGDDDTDDFGELWARIESEIRRCEVLVFYAGGAEDFPFKGAYIEVGMALACGKPVLVALEDVTLNGRTMRPIGSWILDRRVKRFASLPEAMTAARAYLQRRGK